MSTVSVHSATMEEASPPTTWITSRPTWIYYGNLLEKLFENYLKIILVQWIFQIWNFKVSSVNSAWFIQIWTFSHGIKIGKKLKY